MPRTKSLLERLSADFVDYSFVEGPHFKWSPDKKQVSYTPLAGADDEWTLLHELAHAALGHTDYELDVELIRQEVAAWEYAQTVLAPAYHLKIADDHVQGYLDSYRHWLHQRSTCPECNQNGLQTTQNTYSCINCRCLWRVNDARVCRLQRVKITQ